jgi:hypothetical protein
MYKNQKQANVVEVLEMFLTWFGKKNLMSLEVVVEAYLLFCYMIFVIITIAKPFKHSFTHILSTIGQKQTKGLCATLVDILQRICKKKLI